MTTDRDKPVDVELLKWTRDMTKFRQVSVEVQGGNEAECLLALDMKMKKFAKDSKEWELISARYTNESVQSMSGETQISVWKLDAVIVKTEGLVPWSGATLYGDDA